MQDGQIYLVQQVLSQIVRFGSGNYLAQVEIYPVHSHSLCFCFCSEKLYLVFSVLYVVL